ncbi:MAG: class II aldolase/adducin family protein [Microscillaceae bacterium]|nr:class II aldolase/adducin family protein [Microscillaceae bacterium]
MSTQTESLTPVQQALVAKVSGPPQFNTPEETRKYRKTQLAAAFRLFAHFGFDEGVAGHITVRDPEHPECFWVNPFGLHFGHIRVSDLVLVNAEGEILEGKHTLVNRAAFAIHSSVHAARPDVVAAAHAHSTYGRAFATLGKLLEPLTQDACAFYEDHRLFDDYGGVANEVEEGIRIANALDTGKAAILKNHGLLTVGKTVEETAWWFITLERSCQVQLLAEAAGKPQRIAHEVAQKTRQEVGTPLAGWFQFQPLWQMISKSQPDLFE